MIQFLSKAPGTQEPIPSNKPLLSSSLSPCLLGPYLPPPCPLPSFTIALPSAIVMPPSGVPPYHVPNSFSLYPFSQTPNFQPCRSSPALIFEDAFNFTTIASFSLMNITCELKNDAFFILHVTSIELNPAKSPSSGAFHLRCIV